MTNTGFFGDKTRQQAEQDAKRLTKKTGVKHVVIQHRTVKGIFRAVPASEGPCKKMKCKGFVSVAYDKNENEIGRTRPYDTDKEGDKLRDALLKQFPNLHHIRVI